MAIEIIRQLFQKSDASGSKSTILKPITWFISILIGALLASLHFKAELLVIFFMVLISIACLVFFFVYIYCLFKIPDALRSETYSIQKMAIEKGIYGDNTSGTFLIDVENNSNKIGIDVKSGGVDKESKK